MNFGELSSSVKKMQQRDEAQTSDQLVKSEIKHDCVTPPLVILHAFQGLAQTSSTGGACFHSHLHDMIWLQKHQKKSGRKSASSGEKQQTLSKRHADIFKYTKPTSTPSAEESADAKLLQPQESNNIQGNKQMQMQQHKKTPRSLNQKAQSSQHIQRKQAKNDAATKEVQTSNHDCESLYAATEELLCASQSAVIASKTRDCKGRCHRKK